MKLQRLQRLFHKQVAEKQLDAELRYHIGRQVSDYLSAGMSEEEAGRRARMDLGEMEQLKQDCRESRRMHFLEDLMQDGRYGARMLRKNPGFTAVAILTLALGIGANTAIFSVVDGILLSPLPYEQPQQLAAMNHNDSLMNVIEFQRQNHSFSRGGGINVTPMDYTSGAVPEQVRAGFVDAGFFQTLGISPMLGRIITPEEDVPGGPRVAVISNRFWQASLGSDPNILGKSIRLGGNSYTVIGVMSASFSPPREHADIFLSLWVADPGAAAQRGVHFLHVYWRLKSGVTLAEAQTDAIRIDRQLAEQYPDDERDRHTVLVPLHEWLTGNVRAALLVLFGAVGLVMLIACANFAGLLTARAVSRQQEMVIRAALGAGRNRLIRQALTENVFLALLGGGAGLLLANWGTSFLLSFKPAALARFSGIQMNARVLLFVFGVSLMTGVLFGLLPAWSATRGHLAETIKEGGRSMTASSSGHHIRRILVAAELALAVVLLVGAGLLLKGFSRLRSVNPGFNPSNVLTMYIQLPPTRYASIPAQNQFRRELLTRLNSLPEVHAAMITDIPFGGNYVNPRVVFDGRPPVPSGSEPEVQTLSVMGDYFRVMQIPIRAGRDFTPADREGQPLVAIVNEELVKELFPHENPIGARFDWARTTGPHRWMTIVGVVADVKYFGLNQPADPAVYTPYVQSDEPWRRFMTLALRTPGPYSGLAELVKKQVWSLDRNLPVSNVRTMEDLTEESLVADKFNLFLLGLFAAVALILAAVGIYGLMAYSVSQRTHEIGLRIALGAQRGAVLRMVMREGAMTVFLGIAIGISGALALTRVMSSLLFEIKPTDPPTFADAAILLAIVALAACYLPARRAMKVDPLIALRYE